MLVGGLLDRRGHGAGGPEAVGAHPDELILAALVQVRGPERLGEPRLELEDVADLDGGLDPDLSAVGGAIAGLDHAHVRPLRVEIASRLDAAQVAVCIVRAGDQPVETLDRLVRDHTDARPDRSHEAGAKGITDAVTAGAAQLRQLANQMQAMGPQAAPMAQAFGTFADALKPAQAGAKILYEFLNDQLGPSETGNGPSETGSVVAASAGRPAPIPAGRPSQHSLTPADLALPWRGPQPRREPRQEPSM